MANSYFQFKQFLINQNSCAMKVGTDSVLLGAWSNVTNIHEALDIGTGTGIIALMIAQRSMANIKAVEINEKAFLQASDNISCSPWKDRINIENISIQEFSNNFKKKYDLIICNPPFFEKSKKMVESDRFIARHNITLTFEELILCVSKLIHSKGKFCTIIPYKQEIIFSKIAINYNLFCNKKTIVLPTINKLPKRILLEYSNLESIVETSSLVIETEQRHNYTNEYIKLTKDFYLNF